MENQPIKEVLVDENTRWKCVGSGRCCHMLGYEAHYKFFKEPPEFDGKCVKLDEKNRCTIYDSRPLGCKMYPFYPDWEQIKKGKVDFSEGALRIDSNCPGFGRGDLVLKNKRILKKLDKIAEKIRENIRKNPSGKIKDLMTME